MYKRVRKTNAWIEREGSVVRLMRSVANHVSGFARIARFA